MTKLSNKTYFGACGQIIGSDFFNDQDKFDKVKVISIQGCTIDKSLEGNFIQILLAKCPNLKEVSIGGVILNFHKLPDDIKVGHMSITITNTKDTIDTNILDFTKFSLLNQLYINPNDSGKVTVILPTNLKVLSFSSMQRIDDGDNFELDIPKTPKELLMFSITGPHIVFSDNTIKNININDSKSLIYANCGNNELQNILATQIVTNKKVMNYFAKHLTKGAAEDVPEIFFNESILKYYNQSFLEKVVKYYKNYNKEVEDFAKLITDDTDNYIAMYYQPEEWFTEEPNTLLTYLAANKAFSNGVHNALCSKEINFPGLCAQSIIEFLTCDNPNDLQGVREEEEYQNSIEVEQNALQVVGGDNAVIDIC